MRNRWHETVAAKSARGLTLPLSLASAGRGVPLPTSPGLVTGLLLRAARQITFNSAARIHVSSSKFYAVRYIGVLRSSGREFT